MYFLLTSGRIIQKFAEDWICRRQIQPFYCADNSGNWTSSFFWFSFCFCFAFAAFDYYVLWWIVPNFFNSIILYLFVYCSIPIVAIYLIWSFEILKKLKANSITQKSD